MVNENKVLYFKALSCETIKDKKMWSIYYNGIQICNILSDISIWRSIIIKCHLREYIVSYMKGVGDYHCK